MSKSRRRSSDTVNTVVEDGNTPPKKAPLKKPVVQKAAVPLDAQKRELPPVPLTVFQAAGGIKPDQLGGFVAYAKTLNYGPRTIPQWREAYEAFMNRPIK